MGSEENNCLVLRSDRAKELNIFQPKAHLS